MSSPVSSAAHAAWLVVAFASTVVVACGSSGRSDSVQHDPQLSGRVVEHQPVPYADVQLIDAQGHELDTSADENGHYVLPLLGVSAPFVVFARDPSGEAIPLAGGISQLPADTDAVELHLTPLTTALTALLTEDGNPFALRNGDRIRASFGDEALLAHALDTLRAALDGLLREAGRNPRSFDPAHDLQLDPLRQLDPLLDSVRVVARCDGGLWLTAKTTLAAEGLPPEAALRLVRSSTAGVSSPVPLPSPSFALAGLDSVSLGLAQCLSLTLGARSQSPRCAIVSESSGFLDHGDTFAWRFPELMSEASTGARIDRPDVVYFDRDTSGHEIALVKIGWRFTDGRRGHLLTTVRRTPSASGTDQWRLTGDQESFALGVRSFITRRTLLQGDDGDSSRFEAGLRLAFTPDAQRSPMIAAMNAVKVEGPGLPSAGVVLVRSRSCGRALAMTISNNVGHSPHPTDAGYSTSVGPESLFRWSWQAAEGSSYVPAEQNPTYGAARCEVIPFYAPYRFTFYDREGQMLGSPVRTRNAAPPMSASYAANTPWHSLQPATVDELLRSSDAPDDVRYTARIAWVPNRDAPPVRAAGLFSGRNLEPGDSGARVAPGTTSVLLDARSDKAENCAQDGFAALNEANSWRQVELFTESADGLEGYDNIRYEKN
jgi:hypothetical protein